MSYQLYRNTTLGNTLQESLDELIQVRNLLYVAQTEKFIEPLHFKYSCICNYWWNLWNFLSLGSAHKAILIVLLCMGHWFKPIYLTFSMDKLHPHWHLRSCCNLTNASTMRSVSVSKLALHLKPANWTPIVSATMFGHWCWTKWNFVKSTNLPKWIRWRLWHVMARAANSTKKT